MFLADLAGDGPVLELALGTGRIGLPLASTGVRVDGIDLSPRWSSASGPSPVATSSTSPSVTSPPSTSPARYRLVYVVFNTFHNLLTQDDQVRCFGNVAEHLTRPRCLPHRARPTPWWLQRLRPDNQYVDAEEIRVDRVTLDVGRHDPVTQLYDESHVSLSAEGRRGLPDRHPATAGPASWTSWPASPASASTTAGPAGRASRSTATACATSPSTVSSRRAAARGRTSAISMHRPEVGMAEDDHAVGDGVARQSRPRRADGQQVDAHDVLADRPHQPRRGPRSRVMRPAPWARLNMFAALYVGARAAREVPVSDRLAQPRKRSLSRRVVHDVDGPRAGRPGPDLAEHGLAVGLEVPLHVREPVAEARARRARRGPWRCPPARSGTDMSRSAMVTGLIHSCLRICSGRGRYH